MTLDESTAAAHGLRRTTLPNGLTVLSEFMPGVRSVAFGAWVRAASVHETPERMGVSHLLEHMVFKGAGNRSSREIALALEVVGGSLDAWTSREHTSFQARVLDDDLARAADVIGDLVFRPTLRDEDLQLERRVVLEEISMVEDTPDDLVFELHNAHVWGTHPYGYSILGTRDTVSSLGVNDLRDLHARAYAPDQVVVAASGNVHHEHLIDVLEQTGWTSVPAGGRPRLVAPALATTVPGTHHIERDLTQTHVVMGGPTVRHGDKRRYAVSLVSMLLGGGMSARLFQRVREELGLAYAVFTFQSFHADVGMHGVYVATAPETAAQAITAIREELSTVVEQGIPPEELAAGKSQLKGQITLSLESVSSRMYRAAAVELYGEPFRPLDVILREIDAIDEATVAQVCRDYFDSRSHTLLSLGPASTTG
ncbi:MAG TPA: pitrilysin family protein [Gemmatimonadaceae bacterium]|nr:pitrilysin family protein [Gemmatimonadaceae bacterium]